MTRREGSSPELVARGSVGSAVYAVMLGAVGVGLGAVAALLLAREVPSALSTPPAGVSVTAGASR